MNPQIQAASQMPPSKNSHAPLIIMVVLVIGLIGSLIFGYSSYSKAQDYKNNSDAKVNTAVAAAKTAQAVKLEEQFDEASKSPYKTYQSPAVSGSVTFSYPKTWSAYVDESSQSQLINGYFYPAQVPGVGSTTAFALRVEMLNTDYAQLVNQYSAVVKKGTLKAVAYVPPKMVNVANVQTGTKFDGALTKDKSGSMVVIKVRDKTLKIYTESNNFLPDFNTVILATLKFSP